MTDLTQHWRLNFAFRRARKKRIDRLTCDLTEATVLIVTSGTEPQRRIGR
jgi:hypothetical protein